MRFALIVMLAACTHHRPVAAVGEVRGDVTVETTDHREIDATASLGPDGSLVLHTLDGRVIDLGYVKKVTDERTLRGAFEGFAIGGGLGIITGVIVGYADGDDPECDHCYFSLSAGGKAVLGGILFGLLGSTVGLAAGTVRGSKFVYEF